MMSSHKETARISARQCRHEDLGQCNDPPAHEETAIENRDVLAPACAEGLKIGPEPSKLELDLQAMADADEAAANTRTAPSLLPTGPMRPPRHHAPTEAELARHQAFVAGIEGSLWSSGRARV